MRQVCLPEAEFCFEFTSLLERFEAPVDSALQRLISAERPDAVKVLVFEIQPYWREFPVRIFSMDDESPDEVWFEAPFAAKLLPDAEALVPPGTLDQDAHEAAGVHTFERGSRLLAEWLGDRWRAAGGTEFPLPAYANFRGSSAYLDLTGDRWVEETDIWP